VTSQNNHQDHLILKLGLEDAAGFRPGKTVLVHSASGGVGGAVAQLVPVLGGGLRIGTVGRPGKVASALKSGYDVAVATTGPLNVTAAVAGLLADEWVEVVPDPVQTTGVAFEYPTPGATAPQAILLAVAPDASPSWTLASLQGKQTNPVTEEQPGRILTFREGDASATVFLDIRDHVDYGGEKGLLGFAMSPSFASTGVFFVDYTRGGPLRTEIASFTSSGAVANKASEVVIL